MKIRVQVIVESDNGIGEIVQEIAQLNRKVKKTGALR